MNKNSRLLAFHPFHLVTPSPWPLFVSISLLTTVLGLILTFKQAAISKEHSYGFYIFCMGFLSIISIAYQWWRDVIREGLLEGSHTKKVQLGLKLGFILFIISEIMLFFSFFWAFFHASLSPNVELGCIWPPKGLNVLSPWGVPLLNTLVLLLSGATITWAHQLILVGNFYQTSYALAITISLALFFTGLQICEYIDASFDISDGIYGSVFFMLTGLHGMHVLVGTIFISVCLARHLFKHFTRSHHLGLEAAIWYWHFVDVVWLFLFIFVYWWGNK
jgi:cytochrome c oxidase subunit 3